MSGRIYPGEDAIHIKVSKGKCHLSLKNGYCIIIVRKNVEEICKLYFRSSMLILIQHMLND